jgi:hypothetical protein
MSGIAPGNGDLFMVEERFSVGKIMQRVSQE